MPNQDSHRNWLQRKLDCVMTFLEENRQNIFYLFVFYVITIVLFVERFIRKLNNECFTLVFPTLFFWGISSIGRLIKIFQIIHS